MFTLIARRGFRFRPRKKQVERRKPNSSTQMSAGYLYLLRGITFSAARRVRIIISSLDTVDEFDRLLRKIRTFCTV